MIYDVLSNANQYAGLNPDIDKVLEAAKAFTAENFPGEAIKLDGDDVVMLVSKCETHPVEEAIAEAHQQFVDVFIMVEGCETIYVKNTDRLTNITKPYDASIDALLADFDKDASPIRLEPGNFLILFPQDAHSPACHANGPCSVKKFIGKVRIR